MQWSPPAEPGTPRSPPTAPAHEPPPNSLHDPVSRRIKLTAGAPYAALRTHEYLDAHHGQPRPSSHQPDYTLLGTIPITALQGQTTDEAPTKRLTQNDLR
jgi:hypothetical protein